MAAAAAPPGGTSQPSSGTRSPISPFDMHAAMREHTAYNVLCAPPFESMAKRLEDLHPHRFAYRPTTWKKFSDSNMDNIELGGYTPVNRIRRSNVLFFASFHDNDAILSQFQALVCLCESFVQSLTIVLPCVNSPPPSGGLVYLRGPPS
mmetsp:Transcript_9866/g.29800  ORF Transcript_9866/g.29800 Transcript_9866/m.29800 type:complete len:149 (-) Transcript_9866:811-1257(-)